MANRSQTIWPRDVSKVAANIATAGKFFKYTDANALKIDTVTAVGTLTGPSTTAALPGAATAGITTLGGAGGKVEINALSAAGTLDVNQAIQTTPVAGAATVGGSVLLEAGGAITLATSGTITTTGAANTTGLGGVVKLTGGIIV